MASITYKDAGVDIDKGNAFVKEIKKIAKKTKGCEHGFNNL